MDILFSGVDSEFIKDITSTLNLLQPDWRVSVVNSGKECLNIVKSGNCPDVIIVSTKLSDLSGFKLTGYIATILIYLSFSSLMIKI
jgi:CheY-like chemotaxis protein